MDSLSGKALKILESKYFGDVIANEEEQIIAQALNLLEKYESTELTPWDFEDAGKLQHFNEWRRWSALKKDGRLVELPCKVGDTVFRVWKVDGRKTEITEHKMENIVQITQWLHLFGKTVFVLRADAEAYAKKEENQK